MSNREAAMAAAQASLQALLPARHVVRGLQDPAQLGDALLMQGVIALVAEGTNGWADFSGREGEYGTLKFAAVCYLRVADDASTEQLEQAEAAIEEDLLTWCRAIKAAPLDAVYPKDVAYSRGLEAPVGWIVMALEALYV